jgi:2-dehydropantoate 2-reductase
VRCCIVGAGATGGHLAVKLARVGHEVSVIARGAALEAIHANGLVLDVDGRQLHATVRAAADGNELGEQDFVFIATKSTALASVAGQLAPLVGSQTGVVFLQNGMTWWYPVGLAAARPQPPQLPVFGLADTFLRMMEPSQVLGGIVYTANAVVAPGVVHNNSPRKNAIEVAGIDDLDTPLVQRVRAMLEGAGIESPPVADIRAAVWRKLVGNAVSSSLCVATGNPAAIVQDPAIQAVFLQALHECIAVARAHGHELEGKLDMKVWTQHRARHKPSMLQDYEAGRPMEIAEMVLAPVAFARAAGLKTPALDAITSIAARLAADKGLYTPPQAAAA